MSTGLTGGTHREGWGVTWDTEVKRGGYVWLQGTDVIVGGFSLCEAHAIDWRWSAADMRRKDLESRERHFNAEKERLDRRFAELAAHRSDTKSVSPPPGRGRLGDWWALVCAWWARP